LRIIEAIDVETSLSEQMRVTPLTAWHIENSSARGKAEQVEEAGRFAPVALESEKWAVLQEIVGVERGLPPFFCLLQKKTGSRYAPKTLSIAARIS
jgi:hypothetical protein